MVIYSLLRRSVALPSCLLAARAVVVTVKDAQLQKERKSQLQSGWRLAVNPKRGPAKHLSPKG